MCVCWGGEGRYPSIVLLCHLLDFFSYSPTHICIENRLVGSVGVGEDGTN